MSHLINYIVHKTIDPLFSYVQPEHGVHASPKTNAKTFTLQRLALVSIPFLTQYRPFAKGMGLLMGGCRTVSHLGQALEAARKNELSKCGTQILATSLSIVAIASTYFHHRLGLLVTTSIDIFQNLETLRQHYKTGKTELLFEDVVQLTSSSLYLAIMLTGSLEVSILSLVLQGALNAYQARHEWNDGNKPEAFAKLLMSLIRAYQGRQHWALIQRRNQLLADPVTQQLALMVKQGKKVESLLSSPLSQLTNKILEKAVVLEDAEGKKYEFGSHFHGFGKGIVKGGNLCFRKKTIDGREILELDFKINYAFRDQLEGAIFKLISMSSKGPASEILALTHSNTTGIEVTRGYAEMGGFSKEAHRLDFKGIGSIFVGYNSSIVGMYNRVIVQVFSECNLFQLHEMLSFVQLEDVLQIFNTEDLERLKLGILFRMFFPKEATPFERTLQFFKLPISELKSEMFKRAPIFQEAFNRYYPRMTSYETLPGRIRYGINNFGKVCEKLGAKALMSSISLYSTRDIAGLNRIASILKMGMLSTELRFGNSVNVNGLSSDTDLGTGGSDSIFTQLVPANYFTTSPITQPFVYFRGVAITYDLDILGTGTYQYHNDSFGVRGRSSLYSNRPNIFDFIARERQSLRIGNEVMVKDRIPPSRITSILVSDDELRENLTVHLRTLGLIQQGPDGKEMINNTPLDQFIRTPSADDPTSTLFMENLAQKCVKMMDNKINKK